MDCDSCGRYLPSADVLPVLRRDQRLSMACARCRTPELRDEIPRPVALSAIAPAPEPPAVGLAR